MFEVVGIRVYDSVDNKIGDDGCNYLLTTLTRCRLGELNRIDIASRRMIVI